MRTDWSYIGGEWHHRSGWVASRTYGTWWRIRPPTGEPHSRLFETSLLAREFVEGLLAAMVEGPRG